MAEAIAAFSLAANVIQFLDFGSRFTVKLWSFYQASRDSKETLPDVEAITQDLQHISAGLAVRDELREPQLTKPSDQGLARLAADCHAVATELLSLLATLNKSKNKPPGKFEAVKNAFRRIWKEPDIEALQARLDGFRSQLSLHLLACVRYVS
jgi:hypothetical protein